jgi:hypothetical protein
MPETIDPAGTTSDVETIDPGTVIPADSPGPLDFIAIGRDLDEARSKIQATRRALISALDGRALVEPYPYPPEVRDVLARMDRMEAEMERIGVGIMAREGLA